MKRTLDKLSHETNFQYLAVVLLQPVVHLTKLDIVRRAVRQSVQVVCTLGLGRTSHPSSCTILIMYTGLMTWLPLYLVVGSILADWHANPYTFVLLRGTHFNRCYADVTSENGTELNSHERRQTESTCGAQNKLFDLASALGTNISWQQVCTNTAKTNTWYRSS